MEKYIHPCRETDTNTDRELLNVFLDSVGLMESIPRI